MNPVERLRKEAERVETDARYRASSSLRTAAAALESGMNCAGVLTILGQVMADLGLLSMTERNQDRAAAVEAARLPAKMRRILK